MLKVGQILSENIDFRGQLSTCRAENTSRSRSFEAQYSTSIVSKQLYNNFVKVQNMTFSIQNGECTGAKLPKKANFCVYFRSTIPIFGLLVLKKILNSFPLIAMDIGEKKG